MVAVRQQPVLEAPDEHSQECAHLMARRVAGGEKIAKVAAGF